MRKSTLLIIAAASLALAACGGETSGTFEGQDGETGEYTINTETGEASATIETEDGTATVRSGSSVPVDLPGGFTIYPGAKVENNTVFSQGEGQGAFVTLISEDSAEEITDFYRKQAEAAGVEIQVEANINNGKTVGGESPDGLTFSINASPAGDSTRAQLAIGNNFDN
ncbi:MAG: hypothetical protein WBA51_18685 [Erythrobacter sp.]